MNQKTAVELLCRLARHDSCYICWCCASIQIAASLNYFDPKSKRVSLLSLVRACDSNIYEVVLSKVTLQKLAVDPKGQFCVLSPGRVIRKSPRQIVAFHH
jgi:hypothetical protein